MSDEAVPEPYDPELPFLKALEREVRREAERVIPRSRELHERRPSHQRIATAPSAGHGARRRRELSSSSLRVARRSLTLLTLICLVGATAYGASRVLSSSASKPNPLSPRLGTLVTVATGKAGAERWSLRLYLRGGELCRALLVAETLASRCAPAPTADAVQATNAESPLRRYVFGVAGAAVSQVSLRVAGTAETIATHALGARSASAAGLPRDVRYYVTSLERPPGTAEPQAIVRAVNVPRPHR